MQEPLNLAEHNLSLYFMFMENSSSLPVVIDPRIGQFKLSLNKHSLSNEEGKTKVEVAPIQVPIKEVDLTSDIKARNLWHHLSPEQRGIYSAEDQSHLHVHGSMEKIPLTNIVL